MPIDTGHPGASRIGPTRVAGPVSRRTRRYQATIPASAPAPRSAGYTTTNEGPPGSGVFLRNFLAPLTAAAYRDQALPGAQDTAKNVLSQLPDWLQSNLGKVKVKYNILPSRSQQITGGPSDAFERGKGSHRQIGLTIGPTLGLDDRARRARDPAIQVLVHEAVHADQPANVLANTRLREGMAELLSRKVTRQQYGFSTPKETYQPLVNSLRRQYGPDVAHVLRGMLIGGGGV